MFEIAWYQNQPLLLVKLEPTFTKAHMTDLDKAILNYYQAADLPFYLLLDGKLVEQFPSMLVLKDRSWFHDPKLKGIVIYGLNISKLNMVVRLVFRLIGTQIHLVDTVEIGITKLKSIDPEIARLFEDSTVPFEAQPPAPAPVNIRETAQLPLHDTVMQDAIEQYLINVRGRCEYCQLPTGVIPMHVINAMEAIDDPMARVQSLCLACEYCIANKNHQVAAIDPITQEMVYLFNPRAYFWRDHFAWDENRIEIYGLTPTGRATISALQLNHSWHQQWRERGLAEGWHNPLAPTISSNIFPTNGKIRFEIRNGSNKGVIEKIVLSPQKGLTLGRADRLHRVDVDLQPYAGYRLGISRTHARINPPHNTALTLVDLSSSNGTFVNGYQVSPHEAYRLAHGDEIRLGQLVIYVYFED